MVRASGLGWSFGVSDNVICSHISMPTAVTSIYDICVNHSSLWALLSRDLIIGDKLEAGKCCRYFYVILLLLTVVFGLDIPLK